MAMEIQAPIRTNAVEPRRLFIAALPGEGARDALVATQDLIAPHLARPRATTRGNLHVTLAFLGSCDADQQAAATRALQSAAKEVCPFDLCLGMPGCFEKRRGGSIVWRGVDGDKDALYDLHDAVVDALADEGFDLPESPYLAHITLFRGARPAKTGLGEKHASPAEALVNALVDLAEGAPEATWPVTAISLMWSHRPPETGQLTYDEVARVELAGRQEPKKDEPARPRTLFIDADACPVTREALACARTAHMPVAIAGNTTQNLERHIRQEDPRSPEEARGGFWVDVLDVSIGADSADFAIVEQLRPGDVVVTQDIGLASMALGRGCAAIGVRGQVFRRETIDSALLIRHEEKKVRRAGGRTAGPAKFTSEDRRRFVRNLTNLLKDKPGC